MQDQELNKIGKNQMRKQRKQQKCWATLSKTNEKKAKERKEAWSTGPL